MDEGERERDQKKFYVGEKEIKKERRTHTYPVRENKLILSLNIQLQHCFLLVEKSKKKNNDKRHIFIEFTNFYLILQNL